MKVAQYFVFIALLLLTPCSVKDAELQAPPPIDRGLQSKLGTWPEEEGKTPVRYVVGLFSDHDVVFLGELHRVRHDALLVQSLISKVYEAGVRVLATEFSRREDQSLIDSLLASSDWNEELAQEIVFRQYVEWGYQEYIDIFLSAWRLNRELTEGAPRFKILGINDSPNWSLIRSKADWNNEAIMREMWVGATEADWARVILDVVHSGEKVMVHCGIYHAFTEYRQPIVVDGEFKHFDRSLRCGNHVFAALGKRAVTVFLHGPWCGLEGYGSKLRHPADGVIDALMLAAGPHPVGFDIAGSPFGELHIKDAVYRHGYEDFKLAEFCDGWIYTKAISEYEGVTPIHDWVNETNLERARAQTPDPRYRQDSIQEFNSCIVREADIHRFWGYLQ